jgi:hypothetical protein
MQSAKMSVERAWFVTTFWNQISNFWPEVFWRIRRKSGFSHLATSKQFKKYDTFWFCRANRWSTFWHISPEFQFNETFYWKRCYTKLFTCWATKSLSQKLHEKFEAVSLNGVKVQRRVGNIINDAEIYFSDIFNNCVYFSLFDESRDATSTAQVCVSARRLTSDFIAFVEAIDFHSCKERQTGLISCKFHGVALRSIIWN